MRTSLMKLKNILRRIWHDIFYVLTPGFGLKFAMRCKDVTEYIDLGLVPNQASKRFRLKLHLSLCQACSNYLKMTQVLNRAAHEMFSQNYTEYNFEKMNEKLLVKFGRNTGS
jgi:hypothetical protein